MTKKSNRVWMLRLDSPQLKNEKFIKNTKETEQDMLPEYDFDYSKEK